MTKNGKPRNRIISHPRIQGVALNDGIRIPPPELCDDNIVVGYPEGDVIDDSEFIKSAKTVTVSEFERDTIEAIRVAREVLGVIPALGPHRTRRRKGS